MFVGHGVFAFAVAASVARFRDWPADRALAIGVVAGLFGTLPDVDMAYALLGLAAGTEGIAAASEAFWAAAAVVHRAVTHSLVVGSLAAVGFAAWCGRESALGRAVAGLAFGTIVAAAWYASGPLALAIVTLFLAAGLAVVGLARSCGFGPRIVGSAALLGLLTHPFGDLFTGTAPRFLYPLDAALFAGRVTLHPDPTLHLLGAFFLELGALWLGLATVARLRGWRLLPRVRPRAALGVGYAGAVFAIPAPTVHLAWPFVASVLAVGLLGVPVGLRSQAEGYWYAVVTALTAVTVAGLAYASAYLLL